MVKKAKVEILDYVCVLGHRFKAQYIPDVFLPCPSCGNNSHCS